MKITQKYLQKRIDDIAKQLWHDYKHELKEEGLTRKDVLDQSADKLTYAVGDSYAEVLAYDTGYMRALAFLKEQLKK